MKKIGQNIFIIVVASTAFFYRDKIKSIWSQSIGYYFPCSQPIYYSLGTFDTRFGISKTDFLSALSDAEAIWEKPLGKNLFQYDLNGSLKVNLIYDSRQSVTSQLQSMGIVVQNNQASYDSLKAKYGSVVSQYSADKNIFETKLSDFNSQKSAYEAEVAASNKKGGANTDEYNRLNTEKDSLNQAATDLNQSQTELNSEVDSINALATALNQLATTLNITVDKYNTIGSSLGGEFDEGTYTSDSSGQSIDIYQFDNRTKLVRVLAHELGHALGLVHVDDPKAIMYRLNDGINDTATASDLNQVKKLCGIK